MAKHGKTTPAASCPPSFSKAKAEAKKAAESVGYGQSKGSTTRYEDDTTKRV